MVHLAGLCVCWPHPKRAIAQLGNEFCSNTRAGHTPCCPYLQRRLFSNRSCFRDGSSLLFSLLFILLKITRSLVEESRERAWYLEVHRASKVVYLLWHLIMEYLFICFIVFIKIRDISKLHESPVTVNKIYIRKYKKCKRTKYTLNIDICTFRIDI